MGGGEGTGDLKAIKRRATIHSGNLMKYVGSLLLSCGLALAAGSVWAVQVEDSYLAVQARELEALLIAPCCWRAPIGDHQSAIAGEMKKEVRQMLQEGQEHQEILDHYVEQYGVRILAVPPQEGFNRMSFLMPIVFVVLGVALVGIVLQRWHRQSSGASSRQAEGETSSDPVTVSDEISRRIQKELDEMD